jgi:glycosyltransferase involved in cell wall biosynthesis
MPVDVLIPCYNSATTIERTVASVLGQTARPSRIYLHDDASSDNTPAILETLRARHSEVCILRSPKNSGILRARQRLVSASSAEFVSFLDHDDEWPPEYVGATSAAFRGGSVAAVVAPAQNIDAASGRCLSTVRPKVRALRKARLQEGVEHIFMHYPVPTWSCMSLRRDAAARLLELEGFPSGEEFAALALSLECGDVEFLDAPTVARYLGDRNAILDAPAQHQAEMALFWWFGQRYPRLNSRFPEKLMAVYANSVYRYTVSGEASSARSMRTAVFRALCQGKVLASLLVPSLGAGVTRVLRPVR